MKTFDAIESVLTDIASRLGPWLLPLVTAGLVYRAAVTRLAWPIWQALTAAAGLELFGLGATGTALTLWGYNRSKRKSDPTAPAGLAVALAGVYFLVVSALVVVIEVLPAAVTWTPLAFPVLSLSAVGILALRLDHKARLDAVRTVRIERSAQRSGRTPAERTPNDAERQPNERRTEALDAIVAHVTEHPGASLAELARVAGRSKSTVSAYVGALVEDGRLRRNGHGIEAVQ